MKILIMGRTASGKDTLARKLCEKFDLKQVLSATTRPRRSPDEATHRFVTAEQAAAEREDMVASTEIDGMLYYATEADIAAGNVYVIDPEGAGELIHAMPDEKFSVIYLDVPRWIRCERFIARAMKGNGGMSRDCAEMLFAGREAAEEGRFDEFEHLYRPVGLLGEPGNMAANAPVTYVNASMMWASNRDPVRDSWADAFAETTYLVYEE